MIVAKISSISGSGFCIARSSPSALISKIRSIRLTSDTTAAALNTERSCASLNFGNACEEFEWKNHDMTLQNEIQVQPSWGIDLQR